MALVEKKSGNYLSIIGGTIRKSVPENTEGAKKREYETSDGKKGVKYELEYSSLVGIIKNINIYDSEYGKQLSILIRDGDDSFSLQMGVEQQYAEDIMRKLPNIDLLKEVELTPFDFEDEAGRRRKGITIKQEGEKIKNYFYDDVAKKAINGFPIPEGEIESYDKEDWKVHFIKVRKFLINFTLDNIVSKIKNEDVIENKKDDDLINPEDIPF